MKRSRIVLPLVVCSLFGFVACSSMSGLTASADAVVDTLDTDYISINPYSGGVLAFEADALTCAIDIPYTYSGANNVPIEYNYPIDDIAMCFVNSEVGRFSVVPDTSIYEFDHFAINFYNKVFAPNWISNRIDGDIVYNTTYPCVYFNGLDALDISLHAQFLIPNSQYNVDLPGGDVGNPDRFVDVDMSFSARWIAGVDYYSSNLCLPLSDIFSRIYDTYPYLRSRQNSFYATYFSLHFVDTPTQITFCNSGTNGDTAHFPFFDTEVHAYNLIMEDFLATSDVVFVEQSPVDQLLAVPKSFLDAEFIPGFSFGDLILIALGVVLFGLVLKVFMGG